jgi:DNA-directed RNA polymerase specialized sigma24 family protein
MNTKFVYRTAWRVARRFYIPGYELEDLVQECVLAVLQSAYDDSNSNFSPAQLTRYLQVAMHNHIRKLLLHHRREPNVPYLDFIFIHPSPGDWIPIPLSDDNTLTVVIALIENDMSLEAASEQLHWTRERVNYYWRKAKTSMRTGHHKLISRDVSLCLAKQLCY